MLTPSEQKFVATYKKQLQPKRKFILAHGIAFGMVMLIFQWAYRHFARTELFSFKNLLIEISVWLAGGLLYGWIMYEFLSRKLRKIEAKKSGS